MVTHIPVSTDAAEVAAKDISKGPIATRIAVIAATMIGGATAHPVAAATILSHEKRRGGEGEGGALVLITIDVASLVIFALLS